MENVHLEFFFNRRHRHKSSPQSCLDGIFNRFDGVEFHLQFQAARVDTAAGENLVDDFADGGLRIEGDELKLVEIFFLHGLGFREGMEHRQNQRQFVFGVGDDIQRVVQLRRHFPANDGQIHLTVGNTPRGPSGGMNVKLDGDIGIVLAKQTDGAGKQVSAGGLRGTDDEGSPLEIL